MSSMREQSSSFDVARIVRELSELIGAHARKAYQPHYEQVVLRLKPKGTEISNLFTAEWNIVLTRQCRT